MLKSKRIPDGGPMWSLDSIGHYWLMFPNKHALTMEEIRGIFSNFGNVKQVTKAGDERGLRFVQYTNLEDTTRAIEGLKNHPTVSLRPHRQLKSQKSASSCDKNVEDDNKSIKTDISENSYKKNMFQRKKPCSSSSGESKKEHNICNESLEFKKIRDIKNSKVDSNENFNGSSGIEKDLRAEDSKIFQNIRNFANNKYDKICHLKPPSINPLLVNTGGHSSKISEIEAHNCIVAGRRRVLENPFAGISPFFEEMDEKFDSLNFLEKSELFCLPNKYDGSIKLYDRLKKSLMSHNLQEISCLSNNSTNLDYPEDDDEMPDLVMKESITKPKILFSNAAEIIVANIHDYFGPGYMLHLFANYEPIAVSHMKFTEKGLRYCNIYFKNVRDSEEVERRFDNYKLSGQELIVMRPDSLNQEYRHISL